jgi:hypothetical protein
MAANPLEALSSSGKRERVHDEMLPIKHPSNVRVLVKEEAEKQGSTEAAVWRAAMGEYLERRGYGSSK